MTAAIAVVLMVMSWGLRGEAWAIGFSAVILTIVLAAVMHAAMFAFVWLISLIGPAFSRRAKNRSSREGI